MLPAALTLPPPDNDAPTLTPAIAPATGVAESWPADLSDSTTSASRLSDHLLHIGRIRSYLSLVERHSGALLCFVRGDWDVSCCGLSACFGATKRCVLALYAAAACWITASCVCMLTLSLSTAAAKASILYSRFFWMTSSSAFDVDLARGYFTLHQCRHMHALDSLLWRPSKFRPTCLQVIRVEADLVDPLLRLYDRLCSIFERMTSDCTDAPCLRFVILLQQIADSTCALSVLYAL